MLMPLLEGLDGVRKMSKSFDNYIGITDSPEEMFGKLMSIPDDLILKYFELTTEMDSEGVGKIDSRLRSGENPRDLKDELAGRVVSLYHSPEAALAARAEFVRVFREKDLLGLLIDLRLVLADP